MFLKDLFQFNSSVSLARKIFAIAASFFLISFATACDNADPNGAGQTYGAGAKKKRTVKIEGDTNPDDPSTTGGKEDKEGKDPDNPISQAERDAEIEKAKAARLFFTENVVTEFEKACYSCHAPPREFPDPAGPLSIYDYDLMKKLLAGDDSLNNSLMDKARAQVAHSGGGACGVDVRSLPCSVIMEWWDKEFGNGEPSSQSGLAGEIETMSVKGTIYGYAASVLDTTATVSVDFYIDGDKDAGTKLFAAPVAADKSGFSGGVKGPHRFQAVLPPQYATGTTKQLYAYATIDGKTVELKGSPFTFKAWTPKGAGDYYAASVNFNGCGCHNRDYASDFSVLGSPSPNNGGTRTNNKLYQVGSGGHSGGGYNVGNVAIWWDREFN